MNDSSIILAIISTGGAIAVAYIANIASKKVQARKIRNGPMDRMEQMFDGYERLIKQKDEEDDRKARMIRSLEKEIESTRELVRKLEAALQDNQRELATSRAENVELKEMLEKMRSEYHEYIKTGVKNGHK